MHDEDRLEHLMGIACGVLLPMATAMLLVAVREQVSSANIALALVITVVISAAVGGRAAGAVAAVIAAVSFDFFHTLPYLSLTIDAQEDVETTVLLLVVGLAVGTVASKARDARHEARAADRRMRSVHRVATLVVDSGDPSEALTAAIDELTTMLDLRDCSFESAPFTYDLPELLQRGTVAGQKSYRLGRRGFELPADGAQLPVHRDDRTVGRFVLLPKPGVGAEPVTRLAATVLADLVSAVAPAPVDAPSGPHGDR